ncbi:hypothetical protein [Haloarchaeobius sp. HME9146]|uniref:hypothetical protein n=1 Tax=Haloarchaeobius sp. HME9146 TaxID=2978732 RepID=UPI0021C0C820|nr:hypothetical protein [Haloarchaeobius sp. HME9146]MCT9096571.1 hypothetical protein [Haloarchaeobius sp. HME9146]
MDSVPQTLTTALFGQNRDESGRVVVLAVALAIATVLVDAFLFAIDFSMAPVSYLFFGGCLLLAATVGFRRDGFLVGVFVVWVLAAAAVTSGSFAGFHGSPTVWEQYVVTAVVGGIGFGVPVGVTGYLLGRTVGLLVERTSTA